MIDAIRNNFELYARPSMTIDRLTSRHDNPMALEEFEARLKTGPTVIKSHMHRDVENFFENDNRVMRLVGQLLNRCKIIYVFRDGRDVLTSLYFYVRNLNPKIPAISFADFIRMENEFDKETYQEKFDRVGYWKFHVSSWLKDENIMRVSFERARNDYESTVNNLAEFLGVDKPGKVKNVIRRKAIGVGRAGPRGATRLFERCYRTYLKCAGRIRLSSVEFRKGIVGDHKAIFTRRDLEYFNAVASELMSTLGYYSKDDFPASA